jgi:hypothetical protein
MASEIETRTFIAEDGGTFGSNGEKAELRGKNPPQPQQSSDVKVPLPPAPPPKKAK